MPDCLPADHIEADHQSLAIGIGNRLRMIRKARSISLTELAGALGVSYQQVQKYETGSNRISAGSLFLAAQFLKCRLDDFYVDAPQNMWRPRT